MCKGQSLLESLLILTLVSFIFLALGMVWGDSLRLLAARAAGKLQGQAVNGVSLAQPTEARTKARRLKDFDDARVREDQYNRQNEPKRSRR